MDAPPTATATATARRRKPSIAKALWRSFVRILSDTDTYVFGGIAVMSTGVALVSGQIFGTTIGAGAGLALAGTSLFGVGLWLLQPRSKAESD